MRDLSKSAHIYSIEEQQECTDRFEVAKGSVSSFIFCALLCESSIHRCKRFLWNNTTRECFLHSEKQRIVPMESQQNLKRYGQRPLGIGKLVKLHRKPEKYYFNFE